MSLSPSMSSRDAVAQDLAVGPEFGGCRLELSEFRPARVARFLSPSVDRVRVYLTAKRILDLIVGSAALVVLSPVFLVTAILIKLTDRGSILFVQQRVGENGRLFSFYKFRSMKMGSERLHADLMKLNEHGDSVTFKIRRDPRITWIGRIIRKTSIDELPQLFNVLKGDMSLVGPRPALPIEVEKYTPEQRRRLAVQPGLTCFWQVRGRANLPFEEQVKLDIEYIEKRSLLIDMQLLAETVPAVLCARGAY